MFKKPWFVPVILAAALFLPHAGHSQQTPAPLSPEVVEDLIPIKVKIQGAFDLAAAGVITAQQKLSAIEMYRAQATNVAGRSMTIGEILAAQGELREPHKLTALQRFAGLVTFVNTMWALAAILGVACFTYLFGSYVVDLIRLLKDIPAVVWEGMFYLLAAVFMGGGLTLAPSVGPYVGFTGALLFAGALGWSFAHHVKEPRKSTATLFCAILALAWIPLAIAYHSQLIGALAVAAMMGVLRFSMFMTPGVIGVGFEDERAVPTATLAAFAMLALFVGSRMGLGHLMSFEEVFETGALYLGSFVGYLGLLIMSSRWYVSSAKGNYVLLQLVTVVAGIASIAIGSIWAIPELQKIGGTLFVIYVCEKYWEIPIKSARAFAFLGLIFSGAVWFGSAFFKANADTLSAYLLF